VNNIFPFVALKPTTFPPTSRYAGTPTATMDLPDGRHVVYLRRRFLPQSPSLTLLAQHRVQNGDRLDNIAAEYLGDPLQFWQLCDANDAVDPDELTREPGAVLKITLPAGVTGR
jgi:hypothetical protein